MSLNLHFLETFTKIVEFGSFSKTAQNLDLSQSAISQQIDVLEKYFGAKLFERSIKGVELTEQGDILLKYSNLIQDSLLNAKKEISDSLGEVKGTIKISCSTIPGEHIIPKFIIKCKKKYPAINFRIEINDSEISLTKLKNEVVDIAAVGSLNDAERYEILDLAEEELVLVVPKQHQLMQEDLSNIEEILKYPFIIREKTSGTRKESEKILKEAGLNIEKLQIIGELNTTESILTAISEDLGISLVSYIAASKLEKAGLIKCLRLPKISTKRKFYLVKKKGKAEMESSPLKTFWDFVVKETK